MRLDINIHELAAAQHGLIATWQLRALGALRQEVDRMVKSDAWERRTIRVLARTGAPETDERRLMAAVLDASPGAAVSGETAASVWGVPGYRLDPIHVDRHRGISRRSSSIAVIHEVIDLCPHHIKLVEGIPIISPSRVVCELAASQAPARVERNLDWLWRQRLLDGRVFRRVVRDLAGQGRKGSRLLKELDAARGPGYVPTGSGLEMRFEQILASNGEPPMRRQVDLGDNEEWCGRVDFKDPLLPLVVEIQSAKYHTALVDQAADTVRKGKLEAAGYLVLEVWDLDVWHHPRDVVERIHQARREVAMERQRIR